MRRVITPLLILFASLPPAAAWTQGVYVWQRQSSPELVAALRTSRALVDGFDVLAAEISWTGDRPRVVRSGIDFGRLAGLGRPVGLVLRIGPYQGALDAGAAGARTVAEVAGSLLAEARAGGLEAAEFQIDFDCAESKLAGYRSWLAAVRPAIGRIRLIFTALPSWLGHAEFGELARSADGFVLQVHSLEQPGGADQAFSLCDPVKALRWARRASAAGVPFRVALPTYGYRLAFHPDGKFFALAAEETAPAWPADTQQRIVLADASAMARLSRTLAAAPPPHCLGVIWFRLPVAGDRLNWGWPTLAAVIRGTVPAPKIDVAVQWSGPGLAEVVVVNAGETTEPPPARVVLNWNEAAGLIAGDGLGGFRLEARGNEGHAEVIAASGPPGVLLAPGQRRTIAWLRFSREVSLEAKSASAPP